MTRVLIAQLNYKTGKVADNTERILSVCATAENTKPDLVLFGRYAVSGHLEDSTALEGDFSEQCIKSVGDLAAKVKETHVIVGSVLFEQGSFLEVIYHITPDGQLKELLRLPAFNHQAGASEECAVLSISGLRVALLAQDIVPSAGSPGAAHRCSVPSDVDLTIILGKSQHRCAEDLVFLETTTGKQGGQCIYLNMVGGYTSHVFSGGSAVSTASCTHRMALWREDLLLLDFAQGKDAAIATGAGVPCSATSVYGNDDYEVTDTIAKHYLNIQGPIEAEQKTAAADDKSCAPQEFAYQGLMLAVRDFVKKNNFAGVVLGMSGGIDSALVASIATDALGAENVHTFMLPTRYTSQLSKDDAKECATRLGAKHTVVSIEETFSTAIDSLKTVLSAHGGSNVAEENIQSRIRGVFLMAVSNSANLLLLATGNKSEAMTGYMTLYGDTCGGLAPLKSVYKTDVYDLVAWRNNNIPSRSKCKRLDVVPSSIVGKAPSAELRFNQKDQDTLPEYSRLDKMLELLIDKKLSKAEVVRFGFTTEEVDLVEYLVKKSHFKLSQVAPGPMVS